MCAAIKCAGPRQSGTVCFGLWTTLQPARQALLHTKLPFALGNTSSKPATSASISDLVMFSSILYSTMRSSCSSQVSGLNLFRIK